MQFNVTGDNLTANSLRALLRRAQLPLATAASLPTTPAFTFEIIEREGPVVVDSVDSELDNLVREQIQELLSYDIVVRHKTGEVRTDNLIKIEVALGSEDAEAVVTGVRRAIDLFINGPALQSAQPKKWPRYLILILLGLLLFFGGFVLRGVAQTQTNVQRLGGTTVPAGVIDAPNTAIKVNCVVGCGGAASGALTDAELRAAPVPVSGSFFQATQPVSGPLTDTQLRAAVVPVSTKTALTANSPATASVGVSSAQAVASNASRKGLVIINLSNATVCFGIGATAVLNSGICLQPSAAFTMNEYLFATGAINAIASAAASTISIQEFQE